MAISKLVGDRVMCWVTPGNFLETNYIRIFWSEVTWTGYVMVIYMLYEKEVIK